MKPTWRTVGILLLGALALAQDTPRTAGGTRDNPPPSEAPRKPAPGEVGTSPQPPSYPPPNYYPAANISLTATLLDPGKTTRDHKADVQVIVSGIRLTDPDQVHGQARPGEGHLTYRLDWGPVVETTATKLTFSEIPSGKHLLKIEVVANDGTPLGPHKELTFSFPT